MTRRTFKFRAWDVEAKKMQYPCKIDNELQMEEQDECHSTFELHNGSWITTCPPNPGPICDMILMQFTGLQDKNGVDIYEGDVLSWMNSSIMIRGEVRFACGQFQVRPNDEVPFYFAPYAHRAEVIGNVYENPELIN